MGKFSEMTCEQLVRPEGYDCSCGRHHTCAMQFLKIGPGAIQAVPDMIRAMGKKRPFVVCDSNTFRVAGEQVCAILDAANIAYTCYVIPGERLSPAEWEVGSVVMHLDTACDMLLAVGSGVIGDICKVVSHAAGLPTATVGTAPSMDGFASNSSSMEVNHVKLTLYNHAPAGIILDTDILSQAPMRMLWAGLGDVAAKYIALCEWRISHLVTGEYYCEEIADLMRTALKKVVEAADGIAQRDPAAIQSVAEGLVIAGVAMAYAQVSRPASGLEHYFSHMWEMMALERNEPYDLHGIQVGVGTVLAMKLYEKLRQITPDRGVAMTHIDAFDRTQWEAEVHRIFGKTADEILAIEETAHKNDPAGHADRLERILTHWPEIRKAMDEELPAYEMLLRAMNATGMPTKPSQLNIGLQDVVDAFVGSREIRNKYLTSSLLWDLGLTEDFAAYLREVAEA